MRRRRPKRGAKMDWAIIARDWVIVLMPGVSNDERARPALKTLISHAMRM